MQLNRMYVLPALALGIFGATTLGILGAQAQSNPTSSPSLPQKIAQKFNLKESDVQAVFDEEREDHKVAMRQRAEERLTELVTEGKLTEAHKQAILAKQAEMRQWSEENWEKLKNMTPEERRRVTQEQKTKLLVWAKDNGIDLQYLMQGHRRLMKRGFPKQ